MLLTPHQVADGPGRETLLRWFNVSADDLVLEQPTRRDGAALWRIARDSGKLDLNSSYFYLMWCRDFAATSIVARVAGEVAGFVLGYRRADATDAVVVWQVAVPDAYRGAGLGARLLDALFDRLTDGETRYLEASVTPDNAASIALFSSFARRWSSELSVTDLFTAEDFPEPHEPEQLYRIGPLRTAD